MLKRAIMNTYFNSFVEDCHNLHIFIFTLRTPFFVFHSLAYLSFPPTVEIIILLFGLGNFRFLLSDVFIRKEQIRKKEPIKNDIFTELQISIHKRLS